MCLGKLIESHDKSVGSTLINSIGGSTLWPVKKMSKHSRRQCLLKSVKPVILSDLGGSNLQAICMP